MREVQTELAATKEKLRAVEQDFKSDRRNLSATENQYRDQLSERNALLLTIFQYLERVAGDKSPVSTSCSFAVDSC